MLKEIRNFLEYVDYLLEKPYVTELFIVFVFLVLIVVCNSKYIRKVHYK